MRNESQATGIMFGLLAIPLAAVLLWGWKAGLLAAGIAALYYGTSSP